MTTAVRPRPVASRARGTGLIVFSSCCFATSGSMAKAVMDTGLSPQQVTSVRIGLAAVILLTGAALFRRDALVIRRRDWPVLLVYGLVGVTLVQLCYFLAVSRLPIGIAMLLEYLSPVLVTLWVRVVRRVRLPRTVWLGVTLAIAGLIPVSQVWHGLSLDTIGVLAGLATAAASATYFLVGERAVATCDPVGMTTWGLVIGAVVMSVVVPPWTIPAHRFTEPAALGALHPDVWVLLVAIAVVSTVIPYLAGMASLRHLPSAVVSVLSLVEPVVATALAWALLGQALSPVQVAGGAVLLAGALVVQMTSRATPEPVTTPESRSARSWDDGDTSPRPSGRRPGGPPARSGGYP